MTTKSVFLRFVSLLLLILLSSLANAQSTLPESTPRVKQPQDATINIPREQGNGVAERSYLHYENPDVALRSYAAVDLDWCSGTMIGPNVMMTAGHCGQGNVNANWRLYTAANTQMVESFSCQYLLHTFPNTDLTLYWCSANGSGENPGDKYGYIDFDLVIDPVNGFDNNAYAASRNLLTLGTDLYSIWMNPIDTLGPGQYSIFSEGQFDNVNFVSWYTPNLNNGPGYLCGNSVCSGGSNDGLNCDTNSCGVATCPGGSCVPREQLALGVHSTLWSNGGASGSSQLRSSSHRILVGPLSVGNQDSRGRSAVGIADYIYWGLIDANITCPTCCLSCGTPQLNQNFLTILGITNPAAYSGWLDKNADGIFDLQHDLEMMRGENARHWYWLGFESHRRNALWTKNPPAVVTFDTSDPATGTASLSTVGQSGNNYLPVLSHERLNLAAQQYYRLSFTAILTQNSQNNPLKVCLEGMETHCGDANPPLGSSAVLVFRLWASPGAKLRFYLKPGTSLQLAGVGLIADNESVNFDTHDQRYMWRNHNTGGRGRIWPNGVNAGAAADWAGAVYRDPNRPLDNDWSLRNRQLALNGGATYRACFDYRSSDRVPLTGNIQGTVRLLNEIGEISNSSILFTPTNVWQRTCTGWFYAATDDNNLQFGVRSWESNASGTWLVDNIDIERQMPSTVQVNGQTLSFQEEGTLTYPYNTVGEGVASIGPGGEVIIASGQYPETLVIHSALNLKASGGTVIIGQQ
jgi:hypothetical protein